MEREKNLPRADAHALSRRRSAGVEEMLFFGSLAFDFSYSRDRQTAC